MESSSEEDWEPALFDESFPPPRRQMQQKEIGITKTLRPPVKEPRGEKRGGLLFKQKQRTLIQPGRGIAAPSPSNGAPRRERTREPAPLPKEQYDYVTMEELRKNGYNDRLPPDRRPKDNVRAKPEKDKDRNGAENGVKRFPLSTPTGLSSTTMLQCQRYEMQHGRGVAALHPEYGRGAAQRRERTREHAPLPKEQYDHVTMEELRKNGYSDRLPPDRRPKDYVRAKPEIDKYGNGVTYSTPPNPTRDNGPPRRDKLEAKPAKLQKKYDFSEHYEDVDRDVQNGDNHFHTRIPPDFSSTKLMQCQRVDIQTATGLAPRETTGNGPARWAKEKPKAEKFQEEYDNVGEYEDVAFEFYEDVDASSVQSSDEGEAPYQPQPPALATTAQQQQVVQGSREARQTNVPLDMQFDTCLRNTWQLESTVTPLTKEAAGTTKAQGQDDRDDEMALIKEQLEQLRQNERHRSEEIMRLNEMIADMQRTSAQIQPTRSVGQTLQHTFHTCDEMEASRPGGKDGDADNVLITQADDVMEVTASAVVGPELRAPEPERRAINGPAPTTQPRPATETPTTHEESSTFSTAPEPTGPSIPRDLVLESVGGDCLLLGWKAPSMSQFNIIGFEIYVNAKLQQRISNSIRDKALLTDLDISQAMKICVCALTPDGRHCNPATLDYRPPAPQQSPSHL